MVNIPMTIAGILIGGALTAGGVVVTQDMADQGFEAGHIQNLTSDLKLCQADLVYEAGYARGRFTQEAAADTVSRCDVSPGTATVLKVKVSPDGRNFTLVASSDSAPNYDVVADTSTGGSAIPTKKTL